MPVDVVVIGGGPAGAAAARVLASWNHRVLLVTRRPDPSRGLAESLPPSTHKLLAEVGVLDAIEAAGFYRSTGNTAWWASNEPRVEYFSSVDRHGTSGFDKATASGLGYQVFRPDLDRVLLDSAARAGVEIQHTRATAESLSAIHARIVLDCSGRTGVIGRRYRRPQPGFRTHALVGVWQRDRWDVANPTHTFVETFERGWAWSVPVSDTVRHVAVMVGNASAYDVELRRTNQMKRLVDGAKLQRTFACDASLYDAEQYAGPEFLLVGDAGSFIDPLSSFGVKKALASAWIGAVVANTMLTHPERRAAAIEFFNDWERDVYAEHRRRSRDFAIAAHARHPHPFWLSRATVDVGDRDDADDVRDAFERIRAAASIDFALADDVRIEPRPVIRGREIVLEPSFATGPDGRALRFAHDVDLVTLAEIACRRRGVPDVFEAYCRTRTPASLPHIMSGLSVLVAKGILHART